MNIKLPNSIVSVDFIRFAAPLTLFLGIHLILRLLLSPNLHNDDADIVFFNQELAWGYSEQPPLYSWLFKGWSLALGVNVFSLALFRLTLMGVAVSFLYASAKQIFENERLARLTAYSVLLLPVFAWHVINHLTHSLLLAACCTALFYYFVRVVKLGGWPDYLACGLAAGLGILSKYNFIFFVAAMGLSGLTIPTVRRRLLSKKMIPAVAIAACIVLPHLLWTLNHLDYLAEVHAEKTAPADSSFTLGFLPGGVGELALNFLLLGLTGVGLFAVFFGKQMLPTGLRHNDTMIWRALLCRFAVALLGLLLLYVLASGSNKFRSHWLAPCMLVLPLLLFCLIVGKELRACQLRRYAAFLCVTALALTTVRFGQIWVGSGGGGFNHLNADYSNTAQQLNGQIPAETILIADNTALAANLRLHMPNLPCISLRHAAFTPSGLTDRENYLVIWGLNYQEPNLQQQMFDLAESLHINRKPSFAAIGPLIIKSRIAGRSAKKLKRMMVASELIRLSGTPISKKTLSP